MQYEDAALAKQRAAPATSSVSAPYGHALNQRGLLALDG